MEEVLLHSSNIEMATDEIEAVSGGVSIQLDHDLLIANLPNSVVASQQNAFVHSSTRISS